MFGAFAYKVRWEPRMLKGIERSQNPFLRARRIAWRNHSGSGYVLKSMRRAHLAFNVMGKRIWVNKPKFALRRVMRTPIGLVRI